MNKISFPKLNLSFNINPVAFTVGEKPVYWYALIILTGFLLGFLFVYQSAKKRGLNKDHISDIALYSLIFGIIGARIYYVLFSLDEFDNFLDIFKIWNGGLAIYGGIIAGILTVFIYCKSKKISVLNTFDICCGGLFIGQAIGRFGNFVNAEVFGKDTTLPWGMVVNSVGPVHPLFLYEALWNTIGFIILLIFRDRKTANGQVFSFYLFWYSLGRLFLEGMRTGEFILYLIPDVLGISQAVALVAMIFSLVLFIVVTKKNKKQI